MGEEPEDSIERELAKVAGTADNLAKLARERYDKILQLEEKNFLLEEERIRLVSHIGALEELRMKGKEI